MTQIKICGITRTSEIDYLNEQQVDYAGFVFFSKSKRNISVEKAAALKQKLLPTIKTAAVTVSPDGELLRQIEAAGFDLLQVHGEINAGILTKASIPIWRAVNVRNAKEAEEKIKADRQTAGSMNITGYVIDSSEYGSGKTFHWESVPRAEAAAESKTFILAGGLNPQNVTAAIQIFSPDVIDVSTGVEGESGKDRERIKEFVRKVRAYG